MNAAHQIVQLEMHEEERRAQLKSGAIRQDAIEMLIGNHQEEFSAIISSLEGAVEDEVRALKEQRRAKG